MLEMSRWAWSVRLIQTTGEVTLASNVGVNPVEVIKMFWPAANWGWTGAPFTSAGTVVVGSAGPTVPDPKLTRVGASTADRRVVLEE